MIRRIGPATEIVNETVFLWVLVDVCDQLSKVGIRGYWDATEWVLKETAGTLIGFVDRFGIGVEQIAELLAGVLGLEDSGAPRDPWGLGDPKGLNGLIGALLFQRLDANQEVKVVSQQAIGIGMGNGLDVPAIEVQELVVVAFLDEDVFPVVATIVDVIVLTVLERGSTAHCVSPSRPPRP